MKKEYRRQQKNCKTDLEKIEADAGVSIVELKRTQREMIQGDMDAEQAKRELIEANLGSSSPSPRSTPTADCSSST